MKTYMVVKTSDVEQDGEIRKRFAAKKGEARKLGREMNHGKRLTDTCGIDISEHDIRGGRQGLADFLNAVAGVPAIPLKTVKASKGKTKKAKKGKKR